MDFFKPKIKLAAYSYSFPAILSLAPPLQPHAKRLRDDDSAAVGPSDIIQSRVAGPSPGKLAFCPRDGTKRRVQSEWFKPGVGKPWPSGQMWPIANILWPARLP